MLTPVKVGVIGVGAMGVHHARIYSELPQTDLVGVVDINRSRARLCSGRFQTACYTHYTELLGKVEAVNIVVPTSLHCQIAMEFLRRDVHTLVEKPITVDLQQARLLVDLARRRNLILQVGHLERFNPAVMRLREILERPLHIEAHRLSPRTDRNLDVGVVWDLMIHDLDILINLVDSPVVDIHAIGVSVYSEFEDIAQVHLLFKNGVAASLLASRYSPERLRRLKVTESTGRTLSLDFQNQELSILRPPANGRPMPPDIIPVQKEELLRLELEHFAECVATHRTPMVTGEDGKRALELAMQVRARMKTVRASASLGKELIALAG